MAKIKGSDALMALLRQEGVRVIFGNPGTTELPLMAALARDPNPRYVLALNEACVTAMAGGYAQASGELTMVNLHAAPGLGNAMGMLYDAMRASAPLLVTAGQHDQRFCLTEPLLYGNLVTLARPFVKWAVEVRTLADLPRVLRRAAKLAMTPPMGPVFVSLPIDVLDDEIELELGQPTRIGAGIRPDTASISAAAKLLTQAERPLIIAGDRAARADALADLVALAEALGAPVYIEGVANSAPFPTAHPLFAGAMARLSGPMHALLSQHDLLLSVCADLFTMSLPNADDAMPAGLKIVHLDEDAWELGKSFPADVALLGDPSATLPEITAALAQAGGVPNAAARGAKVTHTIAGARIALRERADSLASRMPLHALSVLKTIGENLPPDAVVVEETISSAAGVRELIPANDFQSFFGMRGGGIGWGLAAAVGVALALPARRVIALLGDGSSLYTSQALWTAAHERAHVVFVILNNAGYRILKQRLDAHRPGNERGNLYPAMDINDPAVDFIGHAKSFGVPGSRVRTLDALVAALRAGLAATGPTLIDVEIDPSLD